VTSVVVDPGTAAEEDAGGAGEGEAAKRASRAFNASALDCQFNYQRYSPSPLSLGTGTTGSRKRGVSVCGRLIPWLDDLGADSETEDEVGDDTDVGPVRE
jgi:hypothetical protein